MKVLIAVASRHGSTFEIARDIHDRIAYRGIDSDLYNVEEVKDVSKYDAIILGSAVYFGRWVAPAYDFIDMFEDELLVRPVWLFSSGPIGAPPLPPDDESVDIGDIITRVNPRAHRIFRGRLDRHKLHFLEKLFVFIFGIRSGDYRDADDVNIWSDALARVLKGEARYAQ